MQPGPRDGPRNSFGLLADRAVGSLFVAKLLANSGIWIQNIAGVSLIFHVTGSVFLVGLLSLAQFAPQVVFAPLAGAMADRGGLRAQLVVGRSFCFLGGAVLAGWVWVTDDLDQVPVWLVMTAALFVGVGYTVGGPALQALMPTLVRPGEMGRVVALDNLTFAVGRAVGPAVGGVLAATAGYAVAFAVAAAAQLVFVVVVATLRFQGTVPVEGATYSVRDGLRYLRTDPVVALLIAGVAAVGVGADPAITLAPSLSESLGGGPELVGLFASAFGGGAFVGFFLQAVLLRFLDHARLAPLGLVLLAGGSAALPFVTAVPAAVVAFGVAGAGMTLALTGFTTLLYDRVPRQYLGRIMALWMVGFVGSRPLAAALGGTLADLFSVDAALEATAVIVLVVAFFCRPAVLRRPVPGR